MAAAMSSGCLISPEPLLEHFSCPICLSIIKDVWVTTCLHRFCENCIKESVNAAHRCPLCNQDLQQNNLQRDAQYNALLETIDKAIQDAEAQKAKTFADQIVTEIGGTSVRAILEELFRDTLVSSLAMHLTSENDMRSRYNRKKSDIERDYNRHIVALQERKLPQEQYKAELEETTRQHRQAIQVLDEEIRNVQILFIQAYKNHLNEHVSNFTAVSTQVRVALWKNDQLYLGTDQQYPLTLMRPEDRMEILMPVLDELVQANGDKISKLGDMILFTCINPFEDLSERSVIERLRKMDADNDEDDDGLLTLSRQSRPILEHKLLRGTLVVIHGDIALESEIPKQCFIQVFREHPDREHLVDYFECKRCERNGQPLRWICKSCASVCHKNHGVTPLIFNNKATAPKCDCRKKLCQITPRN